jgi:hypothetical protein
MRRARSRAGLAGDWHAAAQVCWVSALFSCAAAPHDIAVSANALSAGDAAASPSFAALPDVPVPQQTPRVTRGLSLARHVLADALPTPPEDRSYAALQAWIDQIVAPWIRARRDNTDETRFEFGLQSGASGDEQLIALAVLAIMEESTALELSRIPLPLELDTEPEIADIFRDLVSTQSKPFRNAAAAEYRQCSELSVEVSSALRRWPEFCRARIARLQSQAPLARVAVPVR